MNINFEKKIINLSLVFFTINFSACTGQNVPNETEFIRNKAGYVIIEDNFEDISNASIKKSLSEAPKVQKLKAESLENFILVLGLDLLGNDLESIVTPSMEACTLACRDKDQCVATTYSSALNPVEYKKNRCFMKVKVSPANHLGVADEKIYSSSVRVSSLSAPELYKNKCQTCHGIPSSADSESAPGLLMIMGRKSAELKDFDYSESLKKSGVTWTTAKVVKYLDNPNEFIPGTEMPKIDLSATESILIADYLSSFK